MQPVEELFLSQLRERTIGLYQPLIAQGIIRQSEAQEEIMDYFVQKKPGLLDVYSRFAEEWNAWHEMGLLQGSHFLSALHSFRTTFGKRYEPQDLNIDYYTRKLEQSVGEEFANLRQFFMERWKRVLFDQEYSYQLASVERLCNHFVRKLQEQSNALLNMGEGGQGYAPRLQWLTPQQDPELRLVLKKLAKMVARNPICQELQRTLGRRRSSSSASRRAVTDFHSRHMLKHASPSDIVGVTEGAQLSHLLPSEYGLMADSRTEDVFLKRFAEGHLQMFDSYSQVAQRVRVTEERGSDVSIPQAEGPFVVCVDSSGSMAGDPENLAKALVLAICTTAEEVNRRCAVVMFSDQINVLEFDNLSEGLPLLLRFFCDTFHGGTDPQQAISHAVSLLESRDYALADFLLLSDCCMESPMPLLNQRILHLQQRGTQFYTIAFGHNINNYYTNIADKYWKI